MNLLSQEGDTGPENEKSNHRQSHLPKKIIDYIESISQDIVSKIDENSGQSDNSHKSNKILQQLIDWGDETRLLMDGTL